MNKKLGPILVVITLISLFSWTFAPQNASAEPSAAVPGLPFTEDFTDTAQRPARRNCQLPSLKLCLLVGKYRK